MAGEMAKSPAKTTEEKTAKQKTRMAVSLARPIPSIRKGRAVWQSQASLAYCRPAFCPAFSFEDAMFSWFQALMPREDRFFQLYSSHARILVAGAEALRELLRGGPGVADAAQ